MSFVILKRKKKFLAKDQLLIFLVHISFAIQNVLEKIMTFSQNLSENISILSTMGTTSKATICIDGKTETYEVSRPTILWFAYFRKTCLF